MELIQRPRRLRSDKIIRELVRETRISKKSLIYPLFVREGKGINEEISALAGQRRYSPDTLPFALEKAARAGVDKLLLFGLPNEKDPVGSGAYAADGIVQQALQEAKRTFPQMQLIADTCLCEYTSHGHCGVLAGEKVDNDATLPLLAKTALSQAEAGADMIAPSDMMDGRVGFIRRALDEAGFLDIPIMSYAVKYASSFYGPFREVVASAPSFGDRKGYQMDYHNSREALREATLDIEEGADILMVKPALAYGDIIRQIKDHFSLPLAAYSVSGEYAMIKAAAAAGLIDEKAIVCEAAVAAYRSGADIYISYYALELAQYIDEGLIG